MFDPQEFTDKLLAMPGEDLADLAGHFEWQLHDARALMPHPAAAFTCVLYESILDVINEIRVTVHGHAL